MRAREVWIFGSGNGRTYADNSRALYEYVTKNADQIRPVWLTKDDVILEALKKDGREAYKYRSLKGVVASFRSKKIILTNSFLDVSLFAYVFPWKKQIIQLWHGTPLKVLENMKWSRRKKLLIDAFLLYVGRDCDMVISATKLNIEPYKKNFNVGDEAIKITGQPRNDYLFSSGPRSAQKHIWYVPTFREFNKEYDFFRDNGFNPTMLDETLGKLNAKLHLKLHHVDARKFESYAEALHGLRNISVSSPENLYAELASADLLITDYSSVYFDFLLLNRPIIFSDFDYDAYMRHRGFYFDYGSVTPGPRTSSWDEVTHYIKFFLEDFKDDWKQEREQVAKRFNHYIDDKNSERVFKVINEAKNN